MVAYTCGKKTLGRERQALGTHEDEQSVETLLKHRPVATASHSGGVSAEKK